MSWWQFTKRFVSLSPMFVFCFVPKLSCRYRWLLGEGVDPTTVVFAGDSAGGGLVVAVLGAARAAGLPMPSGGVRQIISP
jgi:hypothetical protein